VIAISGFLDPDAEIQIDDLIEPPAAELISMGLDNRGDRIHFDGPGGISQEEEEDNG